MKTYVSPEVEFVVVNITDVIATSNLINDNEIKASWIHSN